MALYDRIGRSYRRTRSPDPRVAAAIGDALGDVGSVVNIGDVASGVAEMRRPPRPTRGWRCGSRS